MKVGLYNQLVRMGATRREVLKGAASVAAIAATSSAGFSALTSEASAQGTMTYVAMFVLTFYALAAHGGRE